MCSNFYQRCNMKLYNISIELRNLADSVDSETGEVSDEVFDRMDALEIEKTQKIEALSLYMRESLAEADVIGAEIDRLQAMKQFKLNRAEWIKRYIARSLTHEEKIKTPLCSVYFRRSELVDVPEGYDMEGLLRLGFAKEKRTVLPDKTKLKEVLSDGAVLQDANGYEISLKENWSLQVK